MSSGKNKALIGVAVIALAITALRLASCGTSTLPEKAAINDAYLAALAEGVAETAASLANGGRIVALVPTPDGPGLRRNQQWARLFERAARRVGFNAVELRWLTEDQRGPWGVGGVAASAFENILREHADASVLISLAGPPLSPPARLAAARGGARLLIVEEEISESNHTDALLAAKAVDAVIRPRGTIAADAGRGIPSPRDAFQHLFEVKKP